MGRGRGDAGRAWRIRVARGAAHFRADLSFAFIDAFLILMAYYTALGLRFVETGIPARWFDGFVFALPLFLVIHLFFNVAFGTYGHVWEYASIAEAIRMVAAAAAAGATILIIVLVMRDLDVGPGTVPVSVVAMGSMLTLAGMGAVRFRSRMFAFKRQRSTPERTLVVGTGRAAAEVARRAPMSERPMTVAGFVSTNGHDPRLLAGRPVLGTLNQIADIIRDHQIEQVILAGVDDNALVRDLVDQCLSIDVRLRIAPDIDAALSGQDLFRDVRDLELTDLLPRPEVLTDLRAVEAALVGKRVLISGAGGSIGSEIVAQVLQFNPVEVIALDHDETHLYDAGIRWDGLDGVVIPILADVRDREAVMRVFAEHRPQVIFHAAAHKHVPILEASPAEAVKTNVLATQFLLDGARQYGAERFILISTDKAVHPTSVMGASKRVAEMLVKSASLAHRNCRYSSVRFGNVLGSRGSVVPRFLQQIQKGGPVTVTDAEMVRYFMTLGEAVQLVLQASALTDDGEVFVLDMGEPIRIMDLAHRLIRLHGLVPGRHIEIKTIGARPGEKLRESLSEEELRPAVHPKIAIADAAFPGPVTVSEAIRQLANMVEAGATTELRDTLLSLAQGSWTQPEVIALHLFEEAPRWS